MPNYYAHLKFGGKVLEALPQGLADAIAAERPQGSIVSAIV